MSNDNTNTVLVSVKKNQNNSKELFEQWNKKKQTNIKCSRVKCSNDVDDNAYIVMKIDNMNQKFILPLCKGCYSIATNNTENNTSDIRNFGSHIPVQQNLLIEFGASKNGF